MELHKKIINQSRQQISNGHIEDALKSLLFVAKTFEISRVYNELVLLSGSYQELKIHKSSGTIDRDFAALQENRIYQRLVAVLLDIEAALQGKKFEIEVKVKGSTDREVSEWAQDMFA